MLLFLHDHQLVVDIEVERLTSSVGVMSLSLVRLFVFTILPHQCSLPCSLLLRASSRVFSPRKFVGNERVAEP